MPDPADWVTMEHAATGGSSRVTHDSFVQVHQYNGWTLAADQTAGDPGVVTDVQDITPAEVQPDLANTSTFAEGVGEDPTDADDPQEDQD